MPKKVTNSYGGGGVNFKNDTGGQNIKMRETRENRTNVGGSVFSNESSNVSFSGLAAVDNQNNISKTIQAQANKQAVTSGQKIETSNYCKVPSCDNISMNINSNNDNEPTKHISFAFTSNEKDYNESLDSNNMNQQTATAQTNETNEEGSMASGGTLVAKNGPAVTIIHQESKGIPMSSSSQHIQSQKRSSIKISRRPSLKYRVERFQRSNMSAMNSLSRRKLSHGTSLSFNASDDKQEGEIIFGSNLDKGDSRIGLIQGEDDSFTGNNHLSSSYMNIGSGTQGILSHKEESPTDVLEIDEIDINKCFPWTKVSSISVSGYSLNLNIFIDQITTPLF
jgi:hypothetical protein